MEGEIKKKLVSGALIFLIVALVIPISSGRSDNGVWSWSNPLYVETEGDRVDILSPYNGTYDHRHKVQLHTHTTDSDGTFRPSEVMRAHEDRNYIAVSITDHDLERWDASLEDPEGHDIIHIPGVEYTEGYHMLGIGIDSIAYKGENMRQEQIDQAEKEDGLTFWAHPNTVEPIPYSVYEEYEGWSGIEIFTSNAYSLAEDHADYILTKTDREPLLIASSDTHQRVQEGGWVNIVSDKTREEMNYSTVMKALRDGEFYAVGGWPQVHSTPAELDITVRGETITVETDKEADIEFITDSKNYYLDGENYASVERKTTSASYTVNNNDTYVRIKATVHRDMRNIILTTMPAWVLIPALFVMIVPEDLEDKLFVLYQEL